ncbi:adenylate/guanylate cyclase domain-containing protein [Nitrosomonas sp.]|uniref:CHASE2 domain-containing protein n=1 Tax=Nitrosomonas sp. TaxID=42353 RepID=UPI002621A3BB|nr:adenylate/guanylate cyclase domain-containing protein [Nitrosomonas sp.]
MAKWFKQFLLGCVIGLLGVLAYFLPLEEKFGLSWLFHLRGAMTAPEDVMVVAIDQPSAAQLDLSIKPRLWPRDIHARLIDKLAQAGARIIIFDLIFDTPSAISESDAQLAHAIKAAGNVVLIERLVYQDAELLIDHNNALRHRIIQEGSAQLLPLIADAAKARAPFALPKTERVNHYWTFKASAGDIPTVPVIVLQIFTLPIYDDFVRLLHAADPALAEQIPAQAHDIDIEDLVFRLRHIFVDQPRIIQKIQTALNLDSKISLTDKRLMTSLLNLYAGHEKNYLNFYGPPRSITTVPYYRVLQLGEGHAAKGLPQEIDFKNKVVFVGFSGATQSEQDIVRDDYHTVFSNPDGLFISGVEIAATAFANLLENKPVRPLPLPGSLAFLFLFGLFAGTALQILPSRSTIAVGVSAIFIYTFIAYSFFKEAMIWLPLVIPVLQIVLALMLAWVLKIFTLETFVGGSGPDEALDQIINKNKGRFYGPCLATDIAGYTTISESMSPSDLEKLMVSYRTLLSNTINQHMGRVMDTTGDSSLSVWIKESVNPVVGLLFKWINKPVNADVRIEACRASLDLSVAIERFNKVNSPPLPTRIGLHFGSMSMSKKDGVYRVTGDVVNTANRIQGANKVLKTRILVSSDVLDGLNDFLVRPLGGFLLPGRVHPVNLFELITYQQLASKEQIWLCEIFAQALSAYQLQAWAEAGQGFGDILKAFPADGPAQFFLALCQRYQNEPPKGLWNTVSRIDSK